MKKIKIICLLLFFLMVFSLVPKISEAASISSTCSNLIRNNCNQVCEQHCMSSNLGEAEKSSIQWKIHISIYESTAQCFCKCTDKSTLWYFPEFKICNMCYYTDCYIPPQDTQTPIITMHSPENNVFYNTNEVELKVSANEQVTWQYYLNSQGKKIEFEPNIIIQGKEGKNTLIVYATDNVENTASEEVVFYIDTITPVITIESPEENKVYHEEDILVKFKAEDDNLYKVWFLHDSEKIYSSETERTFEGGIQGLTFYAIDKAGNLAEKVVNFKIKLDTQTPIITMHSPENNVFYNTNEVELKVSANEQVTWQYYLNSQGKKIEFEPNIIIQGKEGKNTLIVYATDNAGNTAIEEVVFYIDTIKPVINVISPENKTYDTDNILIKFTAQDENLESSWFFDGSEKIYSNEIEKDFLEGSHTLKFYATDKAGNLASETLNFYIELENDEDEEDGSNKGKCRSCERELRDYEYEEEQEPEVIYKTRGIHIEPQTINEGKEDKKIFGIPGTVIIIFLILDIILLIILAVVIFSR